MSAGSFWGRLSEMFRPGRRGSRGLGPVGDDGLLAEGAASVADEDEGPPVPAGKSISRWTRRDQALQQLQEGYQRVTDLIDAMQKHMGEQSERTERIASSLDHLARVLSDLPTASRQQAQTLEAIASHLEMTNSRTLQLAESIRELPGATKAQGEALNGVTRQLEMANETHVQLNHTLSSLGEAVGTLRRSGEAQADSLRVLQSEAREREGRLAELILQQQRRFTWLFVITLVFASLGAAAGVAVVVLRMFHR
jgi:septal ring factor EnvC (AmiA/AmiB activator)